MSVDAQLLSTRRPAWWRALAAVAVFAAVSVLASCGSADSESTDSDATGAESEEAAESDSSTTADESDVTADVEVDLTIAASHSILADVVGELVGDQATVLAVMPAGTDPHDFRPSAQLVSELVEADAMIINGGNFEAGLTGVVETAMDDGVPVFEALDAVDAIEYDEGDEHDHADEEHSDEDHDDHADEDHADEEHSDEDHGDEDHDDHEGHDHGPTDPHFFTDPVRMIDAVRGIAAFLEAEVDGIDVALLAHATDEYIAELEALNAQVEETLSNVADEDRVLVTNHEVFAYFADRYGFEVAGVIISSGSTADGVSPGDLAALADKIQDEGVPAIFVDSSAATSLAETLAGEVGSDIEIVELYTESLGEPGSDGATYLELVATNAELISAALGS